jgi:hypothetical protein
MEPSWREPFKSFRRVWLYGSLAGLVISAVMFFIPVDLYVRLNEMDHDEPVLIQGMWLLLFVASLFSLLISAILYTVNVGASEGPLVVHRKK